MPSCMIPNAEQDQVQDPLYHVLDAKGTNQIKYQSIQISNAIKFQCFWDTK